MGVKLGISLRGKTEIVGVWEQGADVLDPKGMKWQGDGQNCIISSIVSTLRQILL
jgi:hypothetical protein